MGELTNRAYLHTIDYEGETLEQTAAEIAKAIRGEHGKFDQGQVR